MGLDPLHYTTILFLMGCDFFFHLECVSADHEHDHEVAEAEAYVFQKICGDVELKSFLFCILNVDFVTQ